MKGYKMATLKSYWGGAFVTRDGKLFVTTYGYQFDAHIHSFYNGGFYAHVIDHIEYLYAFLTA